MTMMEYDAQRLKRLFDARWADLGDWRNRWEEMAFYIMPQMRSFTSHYNPGNTRQEQLVFDSTAMEANERLSARLHEALTNPATSWFTLQFESEELNKNDKAREWLEATTRLMRSALRESNFDMAMGQFYLDLGCFGSATVSCDEAKMQYPGTEAMFRGLNFRCWHYEGAALHENADGHIDEAFFRFDMTAEQMVQKFGREGEALERAVGYVEQGKPDMKVKALICRFPRYLDKPPPEGPQLPKERSFAQVWVNYSDAMMIDDGGTYEQAIFTGRWRRKSEDIMGYGPGERAIATIRTVNEAERLELAAWGKVIDPPIKTTQNNVIGDLDIRSKGITVCRSLDDTVEWELRPDLQHHMIELEDKRFQIRDIFKYHSLELPPRERVGEMTAFEVAKRVEQIYRALGPTVVQLQADVLNPLVQRVFGIMYRKGVLPQIPEEIADLRGDLRIEYVGPMALAAKSTEIDAMDRWVADALALAEAGHPAALDIVDFDNMQRYKAQIMGVPAIAMRGEKEVEEIRDIRAEQMQAEQERQAALQQSEAMRNMGQAVGPENMAGALSEAGAAEAEMEEEEAAPLRGVV